MTAFSSLRRGWDSDVVQGRVHIYSTNGTRLRTIKNPNPGKVRSSGQKFGNAVVALGNGRFVVSDHSDTVVTPTETNTTAGTVYLYDSDGQLLRTLRNPHPAEGYLFGHSLARLGQDGFVVGQTHPFANGPGSGYHLSLQRRCGRARHPAEGRAQFSRPFRIFARHGRQRLGDGRRTTQQSAG